jgi:hypothetical protein
MATTTRVYEVTNSFTGKSRLIEAAHPAQAIQRVISGHMDAAVPTQRRLIELLGTGVKVEGVQDDEATDEVAA